MSEAHPGYRLFDADHHYYEPENCFADWIEPRYRGAALRLERMPDGSRQLFYGDAPLHTDGTTFVADTCVKPGGLRELLRAQQGGVPDERSGREPTRREFIERAPRVARLDEQGVEAALMFPSFGVMIEHWMRRDTELLYANFDAFNRWLDETWGFAWQGRIFGAPILSLVDRDRAVAQLEGVLARGARVIALLPGPAGGRSPADPHFDAFWARANEAKLLVAYHIGDSGYMDRYSVDWGEEANPPTYRRSSFQWVSFFGDRPIIDTLSALTLHNLFGRFPDVRVLSIENGSIWVDYLFKVLDKMKNMGRNGPWPGGYFRGRPSEILKQHLWITPYHEEDISGLMDRIGPSQVLLGSDYPHAEGLAEPREFAEALAHRKPEEIRAVMRDNLQRLLYPA
jgi:predicted TIM-barrel fold metal-dependent hydrolase